MLDQAPRIVTVNLRNQDTGRLWVRLISKRAFRDYMRYRRISNEALADAAGCSESTVAFLRSEGKAARWTCKPETARAIEAALNAPPGSLFAAQVIVASPISKASA